MKMNKLIIALTICLSISNCILPNIKIDTLLPHNIYKVNQSIFIYQGKILTLKSNVYNHNNYIQINDTTVKKTGNFSPDVFSYAKKGSRLYYISANNFNSINLKLLNHEIIDTNTTAINFGINDSLILSFNDSLVFAKTYNTQRLKKINIRKISNKYEYHRIQYSQLLNNKILIYAAYFEAGDYYDETIIILDLNLNVLTNILPDSENKYIVNSCLRKRFVENIDFLVIDSLILNSNLKVVANILESQSYRIGLYIQDTCYNNIIISEHDDEHYYILIKDVTMSMEILFYKIYHNQIIQTDKLRKLSKNQLRIMKNFIFAKHNYKFESKYLQLIYNSYNFYRYKKNSRTKNISLTEVDKQNLKLIKEAEKKAKE
jgi:hypothetical protein